MQKIVFFVAPLVALLLISVLYFSTYQSPIKEIPLEFSDKVIRYRFDLKNQTAEVIKPSKFLAYAPAELERRQEILSIKASLDFQLLKSENGNHTMQFQLPTISPYGRLHIDVTAKVRLFHSAYQVSEPPKIDVYIKEEPFVESKHVEIKAMADQLRSKKGGHSKNIYQWVSGSLQYSGFTSLNKGAFYALKNKKGDCTEYMYLFSALARALHIPTRNLGGFVLGRSKVIDGNSYHNWADYFDGEKWILADPQKKKFNNGYENYLVMRILGVDEQHELSQSQKFVAHDSRIKVLML